MNVRLLLNVHDFGEYRGVEWEYPTPLEVIPDVHDHVELWPGGPSASVTRRTFVTGEGGEVRLRLESLLDVRPEGCENEYERAMTAFGWVRRD